MRWILYLQYPMLSTQCGPKTDTEKGKCGECVHGMLLGERGKVPWSSGGARVGIGERPAGWARGSDLVIFWEVFVFDVHRTPLAVSLEYDQ
jgi:hypothetical protein